MKINILYTVIHTSSPFRILYTKSTSLSKGFPLTVIPMPIFIVLSPCLHYISNEVPFSTFRIIRKNATP